MPSDPGCKRPHRRCWCNAPLLEVRRLPNRAGTARQRALGHGSLRPAAHQRHHARLDLWAHRHRLHDGVWHHRDGQFRPWRRFHGFSVHRAHHVPCAYCLDRDRLGHPRAADRIDRRDAADLTRQLDHRARRLSAAARRILVRSEQDRLGTRAARLRAGSEDGGAARHRRRPHDRDHLRHRGSTRRGRGNHVPHVLRRGELRRRLRAGGKGVHRSGAGRHRITSRCRARRTAHRPDRDHVVGLLLDRLQRRRGLFHPCDHDDLFAAGHSWPARRGEGVSMGEASPAASRVDILRALRAAALTGLVAFGILLPLIGFNTVQNIHNELILETRWPLLAALVALIAGAHFLHALLLAPALARRALRPPRQYPAFRRLRAWSRPALAPFLLGFVIAYPALVLLFVGFQGAAKWIDNFGVQILIYVMLGWGLNIVVGLAGLLDLGYVAFYAVGAYS